MEKLESTTTTDFWRIKVSTAFCANCSFCTHIRRRMWRSPPHGNRAASLTATIVTSASWANLSNNCLPWNSSFGLSCLRQSEGSGVQERKGERAWFLKDNMLGILNGLGVPDFEGHHLQFSYGCGVLLHHKQFMLNNALRVPCCLLLS